MQRDLRETPLYQEIEAAYRRLAGPGFGRVTQAADVRSSPDGSTVAFRGARLDALEGEASGRICLAAADGSGMRQVTNGPNDDSGPRWSPDGRTLTFLSDRATAGSAQLYALETGVLGEARPLAEAPGIVEHHEWSPDGSRILLLVAGHGAEQTDALGSGTLGAESELPAWVPLVESSESEGERSRSLHLIDVASGVLTPASPDGLNVWEAAWCGDSAIVAIVSEGAGEGAWYGSELALIDPAARSAHAAAERGAARLGLRVARRHVRRRGRGHDCAVTAPGGPPRRQARGGWPASAHRSRRPLGGASGILRSPSSSPLDSTSGTHAGSSALCAEASPSPARRSAQRHGRRRAAGCGSPSGDHSWCSTVPSISASGRASPSAPVSSALS